MSTEFFGEKHGGLSVDEVLRDYFPDYSYKGVFFDVGAFEPITISNSHHFHLNGWQVYCFEANPDKIPLLRQHRDHVFHYAITDKDSEEPMAFENVTRDGWTASYSAIKVSDKYKRIFPWDDRVQKVEIFHVHRRRLDTVIRDEIPGLTHIDILSIDVEGYEPQVLRGLDLGRFPPRVILLENADHDRAIARYLRIYGYKLDRQIAYNEYYIQQK